MGKEQLRMHQERKQGGFRKRESNKKERVGYTVSKIDSRHEQAGQLSYNLQNERERDKKIEID